MRSFLFFLFVFFAFGSITTFAQGGGKAEPLRIRFAKSRTSTTLTQSLSNDEQMEYVFAATKGQSVSIKNTKPSLFELRAFSDEFDLESEFVSMPTFVFVIPQTGDYNLFVRKKQVKKPRTARFSVTLSIK